MPVKLQPTCGLSNSSKGIIITQLKFQVANNLTGQNIVSKLRTCYIVLMKETYHVFVLLTVPLIIVITVMTNKFVIKCTTSPNGV